MAYNQAKKRKKNPCWKGYEMIGTKKMKGKTVPNCVPKKRKNRETPYTKSILTKKNQKNDLFIL